LSLFGWFDVAVAGAVVAFLLYAAYWQVANLFRRFPAMSDGKPRETRKRWPRWLPHRHEWRKRVAYLDTGTGVTVYHLTCMRCRRRTPLTDQEEQDE